MISREKIERAFRERVKEALRSTALAELQETADQNEAVVKTEREKNNQEVEAKLLEAAFLEHKLRFAPLRMIIGGYRDEISHFRDKYAPASKIFTWESYGQRPLGPAELGYPYDNEGGYVYTEGFFLEEPTAKWGKGENCTGAAFTVQVIIREARMGRWQRTIGLPRGRQTFVLARTQPKPWKEVISPFWEDVATKAQQAQDDFYSLNGTQRDDDLKICLRNGKGIAQTSWGYYLFSAQPFRKDWIPWGARDTARRLELQIVDALAPFEIRRITVEK